MRNLIPLLLLSILGCVPAAPDDVLVRVEAAHLIAYSGIQPPAPPKKEAPPAPEKRPERRQETDIRYMTEAERSWWENKLSIIVKNSIDDLFGKLGIDPAEARRAGENLPKFNNAIEAFSRPVRDEIRFEDTVPQYRLVVLSAKWCVPCRAVDKQIAMMAPFGWKHGSGPENDVQIVDVDADPETAKKYASAPKFVPEFCIVDHTGKLVERGTMRLINNQTFVIELPDKTKLSPGILGISEWLNLYRTGKRK